MKLFKNIDNRVFIIKNEVPMNLLNYLIDLTEKNIKIGNAILRYNKKEEYDQEISYIKDISDKEYIEFKNKNLFTVGLSKYYQIGMMPDDKELMDGYYQNILKFIYKTDSDLKFKSNDCDLFKYEPGNFMRTHADGGANGQRLCTSVLYLNTMEDVFEGGEVILYESCEKGVGKNEIYKYRPEAGDVIIFSSLEDEGMYHSVSPIKNWNRYASRIYWGYVDNVNYSIKEDLL